MHVYQLPISLYSFKLCLALALKGATIELREPPGGSYRTPEYRAINPAGTVPALIDGAFVLTETDVIIDYLDDRGEGLRLLPADPVARALTRMLSRQIDLRLEPAIRRLFGQLAPAGRDVALIAATDQAISQAITVIEAGTDPVGPSLAGRQPGIADCGLAASLLWLEALREPLALAAQPAPRMVRAFEAITADTRIVSETEAYRRLVTGWIAGKITSP